MNNLAHSAAPHSEENIAPAKLGTKYPAGLQSVNAILKFTASGGIINILQVKYLNNILEQDHRFIKRITGPTMGFKASHSAAATPAEIETAHTIRKGQVAENRLTAFKQFTQLAA